MEKRTQPRRRSILGGRVFTDEGKAFDCTIRDISETGAKATSNAPLEAGTQVDLKVNRFEDIRRAEVMWVREGEIGLRFVNQIDDIPESMKRFFTLVKEGR